MSGGPPVLYRGEWTLRNLFREAGYLDQVSAGTLSTRIVYDGHPSAPLANEPFCTRSQMISYLDADGNEVARIHQYLRTDGTIGLSGKPDPKRVFYKGTLYILR